jgi:antitoxin component of RelBE/YafQ-DinJ toxin-antitoxin module
MKNAFVSVRLSAKDKVCLKTILAENGFSLSEGVQLFVAHVGYVGSLPFKVQAGSDGKVIHTKNAKIVVTINALHRRHFETVCEQLGLTKSQALDLFIRYCLQHKDIPALFRPDCKEINKAVIVPSKRRQS